MLKGTDDSRGNVFTGEVPSLPAPEFGGLRRLDIAIGAHDAIIANDVIAKGGDIYLSSGAQLEESPQGMIINDGRLGSGGITVRTLSSRGWDLYDAGDVYAFAGNGPLTVHTAAGNGHRLELGTTHSLTVATPIIDDSQTMSHPTVVLAGASSDVMKIGGEAPGSFHISAKSAYGFARVTVANLGFGGLLVEDGAIDVVALVQGDGGEIKLLGTDVTVNGSLHADAVGNGNGGAVLIDLANNITINGDVTANGAGTGYGGFIAFRSYESIDVKGSEITANGGDGAGGFVQMATFGELKIPSITANAGKQGLGGLVLLLADDASKVPISVTANGAGNGAGGRVTIESTKDINFSTINVTARGGDNGSGGWLAAFADRSLTADTAKFDLSAGLNGDGGHLTLQAGEQFQIAGNINVDGHGTGSGGRVILFSSGFGADLNIGKNGNATAIYARSGTDGGNGGYFEVTSGGNLAVTGSALHTTVRSENGNGGQIILRSGASSGGGGVIIGLAEAVESSMSSGPATLTLTRRLNVNGAGTGLGGTIKLIGNGENGTIIVNENSTLTATGSIGGSVFVEAGRDLTISSAINASAVRGDGRGGSVELKAGVSTVATLTLASDISANGHGIDGNGGIVSLECSGGQGGGSGDGGGGGVIIGFAFSLDATDGSAINSTGGIHADAGANGAGGQIRINSLNGDIAIGDSLEAETFTARGGTAGGDGGSLTVNSAGKLTLGPGTASVSSRGSGSGGTIKLTAQSIDLIDQSLRADSGADGIGGRISLVSLAGDTSVTGGKIISAIGGSASGDGGTITVRSAGNVTLGAGTINASTTGGTGGTVEVALDSKAGDDRNVLIDGRVLLNGSVNAGKLIVTSIESSAAVSHVNLSDNVSVKNGDAQPGQIFIQSANKLFVESSGKITGRVELEGTAVRFMSSTDHSTLSLGDITATGGNVTVSMNGEDSNIQVLSQSTIYAVGAESDRAGTVSLQASKNVRIAQGATINTNGGADQQGGIIELVAGTGGTGGVTVGGNLFANGQGSGSGGDVNLIYASSAPLIIDGSIHADGVDFGASGEVSINNRADADLRLMVKGELSTDTTIGTPASLKLKPLSITNNGVIVNIEVGAKFRTAVNTEARRVSFNVVADNTRLLVHEIKAEDTVELNLIGLNTSLELLKTTDSMIARGLMDLSAAKVINNGRITVEKLVDNATPPLLLLESPTGHLDLTNNGIISVLSSPEIGGSVKIGASNSLALKQTQGATSLISGAQISFESKSLTIMGKHRFSQDVPSTIVKQSNSSPIRIQSDVIMMPEGSELTVLSNNPTTLVTGRAFVEIQSNTIAYDGVIQTTGSLWFSTLLNSLSITGKGAVESPGVTFLQRPSSLPGNTAPGDVYVSIGRIDTGNADYVSARVAGSFYLEVAEGNLNLGGLNGGLGSLEIHAGRGSSDSIIRLANNVFSAGSILVQQHSLSGSITIDPNIRISTVGSGTSVSLFVGESVLPSTSLALPAIQWRTPTGSVGTNIFVAGKLPNTIGQRNVLDAGSGRIVIVDRGTLTMPQINFGGAVKILSGIVPTPPPNPLRPVAWTAGSSHVSGLTLLDKVDGLTLWSRGQSEVYTDHASNLIIGAGELIVRFDDTKTVSLLNGSRVSGKKGDLIYLQSTDSGLVVRNIFNRHYGSIRIHTKAKTIALDSFSQIIIGTAPDKVPQRARCTVIPKVVTSQYSLPYLLSKNLFMHAWLKDYTNKDTRAQVLKLGAAYAIVCKSPVPYVFPIED